MTWVAVAPWLCSPPRFETVSSAYPVHVIAQPAGVADAAGSVGTKREAQAASTRAA